MGITFDKNIRGNTGMTEITILVAGVNLAARCPFGIITYFLGINKSNQDEVYHMHPFRKDFQRCLTRLAKNSEAPTMEACNRGSCCILAD
jgi:hypothetical protein